MTHLPPAGTLVMVDIPGPTLDPDTRAHLERHSVQAVCLFRKNIESEGQLAQLCRDLREVMGEHALIAIDQEGGSVVRTPFWPAPPSAMNLGAANDEALSRAVGAATARFLRAVGINWNFAPVLDLAANPLNPVISERAFGADPTLVVRHAHAWMDGSLAEGVATCVKHFPGHGDTSLDSHLALGRVSKDRAALDAGELAPFRALTDAPAVMTAHLIYDAIDSAFPATLSEPVLTGLLRGELGYGGVIITDSMGMRAIDDHFGRGEAGVRALMAGADMVMALGRREAQETTLSAIEVAISDGTLNPARLAESAARLRALAARYPAAAQPHTPEQRATDTGTLEGAWARGFTVSPGPDGAHPTPPAPGSRVTLVAPESVPGQQISEPGVSAQALAEALEGLYDLQLHAYADPEALDWAALRAGGRTVVLASTTRVRASGLAGATPDLHLALWNPYAALDVQSPALITYGYRPGALMALRAWLEGHLQPTGRWPG